MARGVHSYAGKDEILRGIVAELDREAEAWATERLEYERKEMYSRSPYALKSRMLDGAAEKRPRR